MSARIFGFLCAATIPASFGLLQNGFFSSSDGMIHLYRLFELDRAIHAGIFYPRWFPLSGYGYGLPVLNYYSPLCYYLAEFFHLFGAGYITSIKLIIALGFIVAALSMFLFARDLLGTAPAAVAGIAFAYLPYLLSDAYIRGNFPEFLAMSLIPLALFAFHRLFSTQDQKYLFIAAFSFAVVILLHHLTAMLVAPIIFAYIFFLFAMDRDWRKLLACTGAIAAALGLSAFYWVPAIIDLNLVFVDPASIPRFLVSRLVGFTEFFAPSLAYSYLPQSEALLHSAGFPQTLLALCAIVILIATKVLAVPKINSRRIVQAETKSNLVMHSVFFFLVLFLAIFMMLNWSAPLWYAIPTLRFMQFPWRWQVLAGVSIAFLIGILVMHIERIANTKLRSIAYALSSLALIALAIINLPVRVFPLTDAQLDLQRSTDPDYVVAQMGWSWTREFVPDTVSEASVIGQRAHAEPMDSLLTAPWVRIEDEGLLSRTIRVSTEQAFALVLHTFFYPGWQAYVDRVPAQSFPSGALGLVAVTVPPGEHLVVFRFEETLFRLIMDVVSGITLSVCVVWLAFSHRRAFVPLGATILLLAALVFAHTRAASVPPQPISLDANFDNRALLIGYSTERSSDAEHVTLYWLALSEFERDYISFVHLVGANGGIISQDDSITDQGVTPTTRWQVGEIIVDRHSLALKNASPGQYRLVAGLYLASENGYANLPAFDRAGNKIGNQAELGQIQLAQ